MADKNTEKTKTSSECFGMMREMMRSMMSKDSPCCSFAGSMAKMMPVCCSAQTDEEGPAEKPDQDATR